MGNLFIRKIYKKKSYKILKKEKIYRPRYHEYFIKLQAVFQTITILFPSLP